MKPNVAVLERVKFLSGEQGVPTHNCTRWLSNWTHTQRFLLAQPMFGCISARDQV